MIAEFVPRLQAAAKEIGPVVTTAFKATTQRLAMETGR